MSAAALTYARQAIEQLARDGTQKILAAGGECDPAETTFEPILRRLEHLATVPEHDEWRCFYCDERFTDRESALVHFGPGDGYQEQSTPACKVDVGRFREMEAELVRYREEDSDKDREMLRLRSGFATELRREEERGYARGLADARKHPEETATATPHPVPKGMLAWAVGQWFSQVAHRPLVNIHRRTLDNVWRQVIRHCDADDVVLCGPREVQVLVSTPSALALRAHSDALWEEANHPCPDLARLVEAGVLVRTEAEQETVLDYEHCAKCGYMTRNGKPCACAAPAAQGQEVGRG